MASLAEEAPPTVSSLKLAFLVSQDEEYVHLHAVRDRTAIDLGGRKHNFLLLTLARRRLDERAAGMSDGAAGWLYVDEVAHDPSMAAERLNLDVFRIRKHFARIDVTDPDNIIERRLSTRQIRIGTPSLTIQVI